MAATATQLPSNSNVVNNAATSNTWAGYITDPRGNKACVGLFATAGAAITAATLAQTAQANDGS